MTNLCSSSSMVRSQHFFEGKESNIGFEVENVIENEKQSHTAQEAGYEDEPKMDRENVSGDYMVGEALPDLNLDCNAMNDDEFEELVQCILGDASMLGGGLQTGLEDEVPLINDGEEHDMGHNSELENLEKHQPRRASGDQESGTYEEDLNDARSGTRVQDIYIDQIFKDSDEFHQAIRDYAIHEGFEFKTVKFATYRVTLKCKAKDYNWRIHASRSKCRSQF